MSATGFFVFTVTIVKKDIFSVFALLFVPSLYSIVFNSFVGFFLEQDHITINKSPSAFGVHNMGLLLDYLE